ncbi:poly-gamma-glutamate hydrolase family protein [Streptomyces sp. NPDC059761]|uniref:poly-gamma-glutamate hydrolase family protein n=1 Tax=Streptomyces sp. NPDC059761 TaxID=3346937 RepID=UPI00365DD8B9
MADLYGTYAALASARQIGVDYRLLRRIPPGSRLCHIAIHGGGIEPGTTEIADYLAASVSRFYSFDAMQPSNNGDLHITATNFDEPQALALVAASDFVISWHGADGTDPVTYLGGLDTDTGSRIRAALEQAGFTVMAPPSGIEGSAPTNICNRGSRSMGVQMELTRALRESFFEDFSRGGRESGPRTGAFYTYMTAVQTALNGLDIPGKATGSWWRGNIARPSQRTGSVSGDYGIPPLAPLTVDGMPMNAVKDALRLRNARQAGGNTERFWSGPPRHNGDPLREVFEWSLSSERPINRVGFSLARFPQRAWVQYRDRDGVWHPLHQARTQSPVQISIMDSLPAIIPTGVPDDMRLHPQHFGSGHWMPQLVDVVPVTASRFRIVMARLPSSSAPRGADGQVVPYSLGVKDAQVSYRVASHDDLPWLPQSDAEHSAPIAGSTDLLGSQVEYVVRRNRASNLLPPARGVWRCAPQPVPNAVVSLHLDLRTSEGTAQVIDRVYLDPVTSGPSMNLYYTDQLVVPDRFAPIDTPLSSPLVRPAAARPEAGPEGLLFDGEGSYLDIDNRAMQFDPARPFLLAMIVHPQFTSGEAERRTLLDVGQLTISLEQGQLIAQFGEREVELQPVTFGVNSAFPLAVAYDGSTLTLRTPGDLQRQEHAFLLASPPPSTMRLGGSFSSGGGGFRLRNLFLAQGRAEDIVSIDSYWDDPASYALPPGHGVDPLAHTSASAVLRMDPSLITLGLESVCPWGLIGGPAVSHDEIVWTPIPGDFSLRKGLIKFRPVKAKHLKVEFTNLQPMLLTPSQASPVVTAKVFPPDSSRSSGGVTASGNDTSEAAPVGARVATAQGAIYQYVDAARIGNRVGRGAEPYLPTEALYAPDPLDAQVLRRSGQRFPYMPLPSTRAPRFSSTGVHRYHNVDMAMDTKIAYTVALSEVLAFMSDPVAERDTEQYIDLFHNTEFLSGFSNEEPGGWRHTGTALITSEPPPWTGTTVTSKTFISKRRVVGLQFAAQTSDPKQLVADPDFDDPSLHFWKPVGDATIAPSERYAATIGRMAEVVRGHALSSWGALEAQFATWEDIEASNPLPNRPLWWEIENSTSEADNGGIESLRPVQPAPGGRLYAAARVYTEGPLAQPLILQLVNGDGRVIAESVQPIEAAQVVEWYVGVTIHGAAPGTITTWTSVGGEGTKTWGEVETGGSWAEVSQDWDIDNIHDVHVRLIQQGRAGTGRWMVDNLSIFSDPLVWEVSRDGGVAWHELIGIRNNPRGALLFPELPASDRTNGTQLRWRVTSYAANTAVSSVVLRPWYATLSGAVPYQDTLQSAGAPSSLADWYPPTDSDPLFRGWHLPIPQEWWLASRQWMQQNMPPTQPLPSISLPTAVVEGTDEGNPPSVVRHVLPSAFVLNR